MGDSKMNQKPQQKKTRKPNLNNDNDDSGVGKVVRSVLIWVGIIIGLTAVYLMITSNNKQEWPVSYSEYMNFLNENRIESGVITKSQLNDFEFHGVLKEKITDMPNGRPREIKNFVTKLGVLDSKTEELWASKGIAWRYEKSGDGLMDLLISILPWVLIIGVWLFAMRRMQMGGGGAKGIFSFGKARVKLLDANAKRVTFNDVAGADEAKYELQEVIDFLKDPSKFQRLGGKIPRGALLLGPPGTGKTLLARAVAGEANVPFFSMSGADFVEMFVGVGASRVRDLFEQAKKNAPCIIFIDEIDAVGRHRGAGLGGGHDEREQTLNQLLVEMDGFEQNSGIIIIAATNRPDVLDPALLRPGRFDRQVVVDKPDVKGREGILRVHIRNVPLSADVDVNTIARGTPGLSGADLANLVNEAALAAARRDSEIVTMYDFENAKDKIFMGVERRSMVLTDKEKETTAYHEIGHALVAKLLPHSDPVHKVTIIPRGRALGLTWHLPSEDSHTISKDYVETQLVILLGGRAAEKLIFNQTNTGAGSDLQRASGLARKMVCEWGMSEVLGPVTFSNKHEEVFLGREINQGREHSEETARIIDGEVRKILGEAMTKAENLLRDNIHNLHKLSKALVEREILDGPELDLLLKGDELPPVAKPQTTLANGQKNGKAAPETNNLGTTI